MLDKSIFKPYLKPSNLYVGGKSRNEIDSGGKKIYKLSSNENLLGSSPMALQAIRNQLDKLYEYPDRTDTRLRIALEQFYNQQLSEDHFFTAMSGCETLELVIRAFLGEGLEYIVSNPMFMPYQMFSAKMGATMIDVPLRASDFSLDINGILNAITDKTRLIFLTSPNNPTGTYIPKDTLQNFLNQVPNHVVVVLDEVYYHYADAADYTTALPFVLQSKNIIGLNSFSKTFGLAGLRMGYAYSTPEIAEYIRCLYKPFHVNRLALEACIGALADKVFLQETITLVQNERPKFYEAFERLNIPYWKSQGNFILFQPPMNDKVFVERILKEGIMVRPVASFGAPDCVRVTIGTTEANKAFINGLERVMSEKVVVH